MPVGAPSPGINETRTPSTTMSTAGAGVLSGSRQSPKASTTAITISRVRTAVYSKSTKKISSTYRAAGTRKTRRSTSTTASATLSHA